MKTKLLALQKATKERDAALALFKAVEAEHELWMAARRKECKINELEWAVAQARMEVELEALAAFRETGQKTVYPKDKEGYGVGIAESEKPIVQDEKAVIAEIVSQGLAESLLNIAKRPFARWARMLRDIDHAVKGVIWETSQTVRITMPKEAQDG